MLAGVDMSVKQKKRGRPKGSKKQLSSVVIMDCVKKLMLEEGKVPSIRKIAVTLDVDAMAIYHYFSNKDALLEAVTVSLIDEIYEPSGDGTGKRIETTLQKLS